MAVGETWQRGVGRRAAEVAPTLSVVGDDGSSIVGAADLWLGMRQAVELLRSCGLRPGDRLVLGLPPGPTAVAVALAALWDELTLVPVSASADPAVVAAAADPVLAVLGPAGLGGVRTVPWALVLDPRDPTAAPLGRPSGVRPALGPPTPQVRALVPASAGGPLVALSDENLDVAARAVLAALAPEEGRWLSVLAWDRAEGLVLDLLPLALGPREVLRVDVPPGLDLGSEAGAALVAGALERSMTSHAILPAGLAGALVRRYGGPGPLADLEGGLVVGPGVDPEVASHLARTRLRAARGAAELSGLVTIGEPGLWRPGVAGRAVTCSARPDGTGGLLLFGPAVALGTFDGGVLTVLDPARIIPARFG